MTKEKVFISEADQYLFAQGTHYDIYKKLGAHLSVEDGVQGVYFGVWAPNAAQVNVIGTFNEWNEESHPMQKLGEGGIWGLFIPGVEEGTMYKFLIYASSTKQILLPIMRSTGRVRHLSSPILQALTGEIPSGWKPGTKRI